MSNLHASESGGPRSRPERTPPAEDDYDVFERRRRLLAARERTITDRIEEVDRREADLDEREACLNDRAAQLEVAAELERDALATREHELEELAARLARKEAEVREYVALVQRQLNQAVYAETQPRPAGRFGRRSRSR